MESSSDCPCTTASQTESSIASAFAQSDNKYPRIVISFCTQCRWMLRAAYFAQELLSTFGNAIGEIALQPTTGGVFQVHLTNLPDQITAGQTAQPETVLIWDRKTEGGFPETKILKQKVRDRIQPDKDLGHSDKHGKGATGRASNAS